jgi:hypothetical protein
VRKRVLTPSALVRASHVVLAGNTHIGGVMPRLAETLLPVTSYVAVTEPLGERLSEAIAYTGAVSDSRFANYHYRIVDNDRLMWAGGGGPFARDPRRVGETLKAGIARTYPQLGAVTIASAWSGTMGFAVHRMPQIGEVSPGLWVASAFAGHGINTSAIAGNLIARAIAENDDNWCQFLPYDLVWAGGRLGRVFAQAHFFVRNWREEIEATRAQRRARSRLAKPEPAEPGGTEAKTRKVGERAQGRDQALDQRSDHDVEDAPEVAATEVDWRAAKQAIGPGGHRA